MRKVFALMFALSIGVTAVGCSSDSSDGSRDTTTTSDRDKTTTTDAGDTTDVTTDDTAVEDLSEVTEADYREAMVSNLASGSEDEVELALSEEGAACVGPKWVEAITVDAFKAANVSPEQLSDTGFDGAVLDLEEAQGQAMVDAFASCDLDVSALLAKSLTLGKTPEQQGCVAENVDPALVNDLLVKTFTTQNADEEFEAMTMALDEACNLSMG